MKSTLLTVGVFVLFATFALAWWKLIERHTLAYIVFLGVLFGVAMISM